MRKALQDRLIWAAGMAMIALMALKAGPILDGRMVSLDDYTRLQQVRDLLAGQDWHDVDQSRFLSPEGGEMHWSRIPDLFLSGLILLFRFFVNDQLAERLAVIVWPLALLSALLASIATTVRRIGGGRAGVIAAFFLFGAGAASLQYPPGRIDHHGLIAVLLLTALNTLFVRQPDLRAGLIAAASLCIALSVAIESLPFAAIVIAAVGLLWVLRGHCDQLRLAAFGAGLLVFGALAYWLDAPGVGAQRAVCDAYGQGHYTALVVGGAGLVVLGVFGGLLETWALRLVAGGALGGVVIASVWMIAPACFGSPYSDVGDLMNEMWLSQVGEARSLPALWRAEPHVAFAGFGVAASAFGAAVWMRFRAAGQDEFAWSILTLLIALGIILMAWQIRAVTMTHILASAAAGAAIGAQFSVWVKKRGAPPLLHLAALALVLSPVSWSRLGELVATPAPQQEETPRLAPQACYDPAAFKPLGALAPAVMFSQIDLGPAVLAQTHHAILSAPYHRNLRGIENTIMVYLSPAHEARERLDAMGADYVVVCPASEAAYGFHKRAPEGLSADMQAGRLPEWLEPVALEGAEPLELYRIKSVD